MKKKILGANTFYNWYLGIVTALAVLPVIAPLLLKIGLEFPAKMIYLVYSFFCHQFSTRSIHLYDYQYAWCARDTGIWLGVALTAWALKYKKVRAIKWYWIIPFVIPIALDGGLQTIFTMLNITNSGGLSGIPIYSSNNLVRFLTGSFFGIGLSLFVSGTFLESTQKEESEVKEKFYFKNFFKSKQVWAVTKLMGLLLIIYLVTVALWQGTSAKFLPSDFADSAVRLQDSNFFERRSNGACPTTGVNDLFNLECFFR